MDEAVKAHAYLCKVHAVSGEGRGPTLAFDDLNKKFHSRGSLPPPLPSLHLADACSGTLGLK